MPYVDLRIRPIDKQKPFHLHDSYATRPSLHMEAVLFTFCQVLILRGFFKEQLLVIKQHNPTSNRPWIILLIL